MLGPVANEPLTEVTLFELAQLSLRSAVAFAARCARRIRPRLQLSDDAPDRLAQLGAVDAAIDLAEAFARGEPADAAAAAAAADTAAVIAEATGQETYYAAYAASHAARAASWGADAQRTEALTELIAAAYGASRVLQANTERPLLGLVVGALRADYDKLLEFSPRQSGELGGPVDASAAGPLGPLWPLGSPWWFDPAPP